MSYYSNVNIQIENSYRNIAILESEIKNLPKDSSIKRNELINNISKVVAHLTEYSPEFNGNRQIIEKSLDQFEFNEIEIQLSKIKKIMMERHPQLKEFEQKKIVEASAICRQDEIHKALKGQAPVELINIIKEYSRDHIPAHEVKNFYMHVSQCNMTDEEKMAMWKNFVGTDLVDHLIRTMTYCNIRDLSKKLNRALTEEEQKATTQGTEKLYNTLQPLVTLLVRSLLKSYLRTGESLAVHLTHTKKTKGSEKFIEVMSKVDQYLRFENTKYFFRDIVPLINHAVEIEKRMNEPNLPKINPFTSSWISFPPFLWNLNNLTDLDLEYADYPPIPPEISKLQNLHTLAISSRKNSIPQEIFTLKKLFTLTIGSHSGDVLTTLPDNLFRDLPELSMLNVRSHKIEKIPQSIIDQILGEKTIILDFRNNPLLPEEIDRLENAMEQTKKINPKKQFKISYNDKNNKLIDAWFNFVVFYG